MLRSYASIAYHQAQAQLSAVLAEQALIQARIPFDLIFDEHLADLSKYRALVLPNSECLSDRQLAAIRRFVTNGGGLVTIGPAGLYDEWRRLRLHPGLNGLIDGQQPARAYEERVERTEITGTAVRKQAGRGRSVYLPALRYDGHIPELGSYFHIDNRFWKRPRNWKEFADGVRWAAKEEIPVSIGGPDYLLANVVSQPGTKRLIIHLVNYNARVAAVSEPVEISCRIPAPAAGVRIYSPDLPEPLDVTPKNSAGEATFRMPPVKVYTIAVVAW